MLIRPDEWSLPSGIVVDTAGKCLQFIYTRRQMSPPIINYVLSPKSDGSIVNHCFDS